SHLLVNRKSNEKADKYSCTKENTVNYDTVPPSQSKFFICPPTESEFFIYSVCLPLSARKALRNQSAFSLADDVSKVHVMRVA
ncbi:hypothetical protein BaRGS_00009059, partial [Batillaria attramentaria]